MTLAALLGRDQTGGDQTSRRFVRCANDPARALERLHVVRLVRSGLTDRDLDDMIAKPCIFRSKLGDPAMGTGKLCPDIERALIRRAVWPVLSLGRHHGP